MRKRSSFTSILIAAIFGYSIAGPVGAGAFAILTMFLTSGR